MSERISLRVAAKMAGISPRTMRKYIAEGTIPGYRVGPKLLFVDLDDLTGLITRRATTGDVTARDKARAVATTGDPNAWNKVKAGYPANFRAA